MQWEVDIGRVSPVKRLATDEHIFHAGAHIWDIELECQSFRVDVVVVGIDAWVTQNVAAARTPNAVNQSRH